MDYSLFFSQGTSFDRMAPIFEGEGRRIKRMALKNPTAQVVRLVS